MAKQTGAACRIRETLHGILLFGLSYWDYVSGNMFWYVSWFVALGLYISLFQLAKDQPKIKCNLKHCLDVEDPAHKYAARCVDGIMYLDF